MTIGSQLSNGFKTFDIFGRRIGFEIDDGKTKFKTCSGALVSLIILTLITLPALNKFNSMMNRELTLHHTSQELYITDSNDRLSYYSTGMNFAFGLAEINPANHVQNKVETVGFVDIKI